MGGTGLRSTGPRSSRALPMALLQLPPAWKGTLQWLLVAFFCFCLGVQDLTGTEVCTQSASCREQIFSPGI